MWRSIKILITAASAVFLVGCNQTAGPRQQSGTVIGALVGGAIGSQFGGNVGSRIAAGVLGAAIGGLIGNQIGGYLDEQDRARLAAITRQTAITGSTRQFTSLKSGARVRTRVVNTRVNVAGDTCRTVEQEIVLRDGTAARDTVQACRTNGQWQV
jgi:surface antigen